jgi:hypothetical protein
MSDTEPAPLVRPSQPSRLRALRDSLFVFAAVFGIWAAVATGQSLYAGVGSHFGYFQGADRGGGCARPFIPVGGLPRPNVGTRAMTFGCPAGPGAL